jgi:hypothetical protein
MNTRVTQRMVAEKDMRDDSKVFLAGYFALSVHALDAVIMQWIEFLTTEVDKCRNMDSVNPLKLVNCADLN